MGGCRRNAANTESSECDQAGSRGQHRRRSIDPATAGSISGVVHFSGKAPERIKIDMSADPACALSDTPNYTEQYVVANGKLANVFVYVKSGIPAWSASVDAPPVVMDQKGCRYVPHVIGVQQGGKVEYRNSDPATHNVHTLPQDPANHSVDVSEMPGGEPQTRDLPLAGADDSGALQQSSVDAGVHQRGTERLFRRHGAGRKLYTSRTASGHLYCGRRP